MKRIAVTGAGGFLGREVVRQLSEIHNCHVYILTRNKHLFEGYSDRCTIVMAEEYTSIPFENIDIIISLAFPTNPKETKKTGLGLQYVYSLLYYAISHKVKGIIDISTQSVYGVHRNYVPAESDMVNLDTSYGVGKYGVEVFLDTICEKTKVVHLRMASLIGPGLDDRVTNKMIDSVIEEQDISVVGGDQVFGYMDYRDGADAIITCLMNIDKCRNKEVFNVASNSYQLREIGNCIKTIAREKGFNTCLIEEKNQINRNTGIDSKKFREIMSWKAKYTLRDSIETIFNNKMR